MVRWQLAGPNARVSQLLSHEGGVRRNRTEHREAVCFARWAGKHLKCRLESEPTLEVSERLDVDAAGIVNGVSVSDHQNA